MTMEKLLSSCHSQGKRAGKGTKGRPLTTYLSMEEGRWREVAVSYQEGSHWSRPGSSWASSHGGCLSVSVIPDTIGHCTTLQCTAVQYSTLQYTAVHSRVECSRESVWQYQSIEAPFHRLTLALRETTQQPTTETLYTLHSKLYTTHSLHSTLYT